MILSALSAATLMFAAAPDTALAYAEAQARAKKYDEDPLSSNYRTTILAPMLSKAMPPIFEACAPGEMRAPHPNFTAVLSFKAGKFEAVRHTSSEAIAQCVVERMGRLDWPTPPRPDFAETFNIKMSGD